MPISTAASAEHGRRRKGSGRLPLFGRCARNEAGRELCLQYWEAAMRGKEAVEQCRAYLEQTNAVARELGKLTSVSVRWDF